MTPWHELATAPPDRERKTIIGKRELCLIITVDPCVFDAKRAYTINAEGRTWTGCSPQVEEDGAMRFYLPLTTQ